MIVTTRLLTTGSIVSAIISRNVHIGTLQQEFKIVHTTEATLRQSILGILCKNSSSYQSFSNCDRHDDSIRSCRDQEQNLMEPFYNYCEAQKILSSTKSEISCQLRDIVLKEDFLVRSRTNDAGDEMMRFGEKKWPKTAINREKYKSMRGWRPVATETPEVNSQTHFVLRIISYNILAQSLLEGHSYLYRDHSKKALEWDSRIELLQKEILKADANVICLQEMQVDYLEEFVAVFVKSGYNYLYKKRTNDKRDGLLLLYKTDQLKICDWTEVELYQDNIDILNRDNVGIVAKFSLVESPDTYVVISTTHLLYNPKREDVRLAQTQLLLAEIDKIAFMKWTRDGPCYHPIILSGDFNLQPYTGVYKFITEGSFEYKGRGRNLELALLCGLGNTLIPPHLLVTDNCQYFNTLVKRLRGEIDDTTMLEKIERKTECSVVRDKDNDKTENSDKVNIRTLEYQKVKIVEGHYAKFSSGALTHPFELKSLYRHINNEGQPEATTHQDKWVTVDYIFYSDVEPIDKYNLPTVAECKKLWRIPNAVVGSDHLCLGATFKLKKIKR